MKIISGDSDFAALVTKYPSMRALTADEVGRAERMTSHGGDARLVVRLKIALEMGESWVITAVQRLATIERAFMKWPENDPGSVWLLTQTMRHARADNLEIAERFIAGEMEAPADLPPDDAVDPLSLLAEIIADAFGEAV